MATTGVAVLAAFTAASPTAISTLARAAFEYALHTVLLVAAFCAMLDGIVGWLRIGLLGSQAVR